MDGRGALGSGRRAGVHSQASQVRPSEKLGSAPGPAPLPQTCLCGVCGEGRIVLAGCSLLGTLNRCRSLGLSVCFCGMGTRISCSRIRSQAPRARTGCLRDALPQWRCLVDLCPPPCTQDTPMRSSNRQLHKEKQTVSTAPGMSSGPQGAGLSREQGPGRGTHRLEGCWAPGAPCVGQAVELTPEPPDDRRPSARGSVAALSWPHWPVPSARRASMWPVACVLVVPLCPPDCDLP